MLNSIKDIRLIKLAYFTEDNGELIVMEGKRHVPFAIARVFAVRAPVGSVRGEHAHKACTQFLSCPKGRVKVVCDDGSLTQEYILKDFNEGLLIPFGIWVRYTYEVPDSILTVLCDRPYEVSDYIRDYGEFKSYRQTDRLTEKGRSKV